jgi:hypothetical protein
MICEKCGKEFSEDWRKDRWSRNNTSCRFCSRGCANNKPHSEEMNLKIANGVKKHFNSLPEEKKKEISGRLNNFRATPEQRKNVGNILREKARIKSKDLFIENKTELISYKRLRKFLLEEANNTCQKCGNDTWLGEPIWLEVHHIDDNNSNNKKENLMVVCLNCHASLDKNYRFTGRKHTEPVLDGFEE